MASIKFLPKSKLGKWSVGLITTMFLLFISGRLFYLNLYESVPSGETILSDIWKRPALALSMLSGFACGIIAFITGLGGIIKSRERSILVFLTTIIGALLIFLLSGEIISPH